MFFTLAVITGVLTFFFMKFDYQGQEMVHYWSTAIGGIIAILSGVCTVFFQSFLTEKREKKATRIEAFYLATKLVVILDEFAIKCYNRSLMVELYCDTNGSLGDSDLNIPELSPFPNDVNWKTLKPDILPKVLSFPNELLQRKKDIAETYSCDGLNINDLLIKCSKQSCKYGYMALQLANEIRKRYQIPVIITSNVEMHLKRYHNQVIANATTNIG